MKILTAILSCSDTQDRANSCLNTWIKDIKPPHNYFFYGDEKQSKIMMNTWNCTPDKGECRSRLPEKTYKMLEMSLDYDWDFLFKCDDDTYVVFDMLVELLQTYNPLENLCLGYTIGHLHESIREHLKSIGLHKSKKLQNLLKISNGDTLRLKGLLSPKLINDHDNTFRFRWAQGGAGYILTRSSVIKCLNSLKLFYQNESKNNRAEDYSVGLALEMEGVHLNHIDQLNTHAPQIAKKYQSVCVNDIIKDNKITTHYVKAETMQLIHESIYKK